MLRSLGDEKVSLLRKEEGGREGRDIKKIKKTLILPQREQTKTTSSPLSRERSWRSPPHAEKKCTVTSSTLPGTDENQGFSLARL